MKRSQSQSSDCKVCAPNPCVLKSKSARKDMEEEEEECRYCPPGKCIKKKPAGEPGACRVCAPNPCILKKPDSGSDCKVCAPHPCVLSSKGTPLKSPKLVARSKSVSGRGDSSCRLCAPNPCVMKKKEEMCPHCQHLHPCAFNWKIHPRFQLCLTFINALTSNAFNKNQIWKSSGFLNLVEEYFTSPQTSKLKIKMCLYLFDIRQWGVFVWFYLCFLVKADNQAAANRATLSV